MCAWFSVACKDGLLWLVRFDQDGESGRIDVQFKRRFSLESRANQGECWRTDSGRYNGIMFDAEI